MINKKNIIGPNIKKICYCIGLKCSQIVQNKIVAINIFIAHELSFCLTVPTEKYLRIKIWNHLLNWLEIDHIKRLGKDELIAQRKQWTIYSKSIRKKEKMTFFVRHL